MPRPKGSTRRSAAAPQKNTLDFQTKITKPHAGQSSLIKDASAKASKLNTDPALAQLKLTSATPSPAPASPTSEQAPSREAAAPSQRAAAPELTEDELHAASISDSQVEQYWQEKEDSRIFPRVHQKGLSLHDKVLREFDLSSQFGPCIGIPRHRRWLRARRLGLEPPFEVLAVLLREEEHGRPVQTAFMDELMGAKQVAADVR